MTVIGITAIGKGVYLDMAIFACGATIIDSLLLTIDAKVLRLHLGEYLALVNKVIMDVYISAIDKLVY